MQSLSPQPGSCGVTRGTGASPQDGVGSWGSGRGSRVVDDVEFLPFLEAQVILRPGLVVIQGDEERHAPTCGTWRGLRDRLGPPQTPSPCSPPSPADL